MGWGDCGTDSKGRPIGYYFEAECDEPGCPNRIDRGLSFACGGMHGETEYGCEKYFCSQHLESVYADDEAETLLCEGKFVCRVCSEQAVKHFKEYGGEK